MVLSLFMCALSQNRRHVLEDLHLRNIFAIRDKNNRRRIFLDFPHSKSESYCECTHGKCWNFWSWFLWLRSVSSAAPMRKCSGAAAAPKLPPCRIWSWKRWFFQLTQMELSPSIIYTQFMGIWYEQVHTRRWSGDLRCSVEYFSYTGPNSFYINSFTYSPSWA